MPVTEPLTNSIQSLPVEKVLDDQQTGPDGQFFASRLISTTSPVVVRQDGPSGPHYQEATGYTFLVNSPKYPGLCRMDSGRIVVTLSVAVTPATVFDDQGRMYLDETQRQEMILFSDDDGVSWSRPRRIAGYRTAPMNLGGNNLLVRGWLGTSDGSDPFAFWFSENAGETWSEHELIPPVAEEIDAEGIAVKDCRVNTDVPLHPLIEKETAAFLFYIHSPQPIAPDWRAQTIMRPYNFGTRQWGETYFFPRQWRSSEGCIARAGNGDLVIALRTGRPDLSAVSYNGDTPSRVPSDHWRGISTARSADNGKTWSEPQVHFAYGHVHQSLLNLPDRRMLMTYAARIGELEGKTYHGIEAVISHDDGVTWDWEHRFILFRARAGLLSCPYSVVLGDGRVLTMFMHSTSFPWNDGTIQGNLLAVSHVSTVIWSAG